MATVKNIELELNKQSGDALKEKLDSIEQQLDEAEKRAEEAEKQEDAMYEDFQKELSRDLDAKLLAAKEATASSGLADIETRLYQSHMEESSKMIKMKQMDTMRTNKVIREVSIALKDEWKPVFQYLLASIMSKTEVEQQMRRIERQQRPLMQAFKALATWKEIKGDEANLNQLADALRINKKLDLADYVLDALDCEGDSFNALKSPAAEAKAEDGAEGGEGGKPAIKKKVPEDRAGILDDRKFLQLSKKIGTDWEPMATTLGLAEIDIQEIMEAEGATYQGSFKMLWTWRDRTIELDQDNAQILKEALKACGKEDVAKMV